MWLVQHIAGDIRCVDYIEDSQRPFTDYPNELHQRRYTYRTPWVPHDAKAKSLGTGRSIEEIARNAGWRVKIVPRLSVADGQNLGRVPSLGSRSVRAPLSAGISFRSSPEPESKSEPRPVE